MENSRKSNYTNRYEQFIFIFESFLMNLKSKVFYNDYNCIPMLVRDMVTNAVIEICMDPVLMKAAEEKAKTSSPEEQYIADFKIETGEDPVIVLKNNEFESVTTRERAKYLKHANVYEIAVKVSN